MYDIVMASGYGGGLVVFKDVLNRPSPIITGDVYVDGSVAPLNGRMHFDNDMLAAADNDSNGIHIWNSISTLTDNQAPDLRVGSDWYYSVQLVNGDLYAAANSSEMHIWRNVAAAGAGDPPDVVWSAPDAGSVYFCWVDSGRLYAATNSSPDHIYIMNDAATVTGASVPDVTLSTLDWARRLYFHEGTMYQPLMSGGIIAGWSDIATVTTGTSADIFVLSGMDEYTCMTFGGGRAWMAEMWGGETDPIFSSFALGANIADDGPANETLFLDMVYQLAWKEGLLFGSAGYSTGGAFWYYNAANSLVRDPDGWALDPRIQIAKQMYVSKR